MSCPGGRDRGGAAEMTEKGPIHGRRWLSSTDGGEVLGWAVP